MVRLSDWYNQYIAIRIPGDERVFHTQITYVHDLPPDTVWYDNREFVSHISPELKYVSLVLIRNPLPSYFHADGYCCLSLDAETGEWFYCTRTVARVPVLVDIVAKK